MTKPILFNTEMVKALLDGRKTATRRVVKPQSQLNCPCGTGYYFDIESQILRCTNCGSWVAKADGRTPLTPPYTPGNILYVRETFCEYDADHIIDGVRYAYKADATPVSEEFRKQLGYKWSPSLHMPREAARIFLRVTDVRVERLQDITEEQAIAEGVRIGLGGEPFFSCKDAFVRLWDSTLPKNPNKFKCPENSWTTNPFVWVIEFEKISKEDALNA